MLEFEKVYPTEKIYKQDWKSQENEQLFKSNSVESFSKKENTMNPYLKPISLKILHLRIIVKGLNVVLKD